MGGSNRRRNISPAIWACSLGLSIRKNGEQRREVRIRTVQVVQSWAAAWRRGCRCCSVCRLFRENVRHWYVPDNIYLTKIKIGLEQNNALDSWKSKALKAVAMWVQPCCAHVLWLDCSSMLCLAGRAQPPGSPRERLHWQWTRVVQWGVHR